MDSNIVYYAASRDRAADPLMKYIANQIVMDHSEEETKTRKIARPIFLTLSIVVISSGNIPWIDYSLQYGRRYDSEAFGIILAAGDSISYATYVVWSFFELVNNKLHAKTAAENALEVTAESTGFKVLSRTVLAAMSVFGSVTVAWMASYANRNSTSMPKWIYPAIIMVTFPITSYLSLKLSFDALRLKFLTPFEKTLLTTKSSLKQGLESLEQTVLALSAADRQAFLQTLEEADWDEKDDDKINVIAQKFLTHFSRNNNNSDESQTGHYISGAFGFVMGCALISHHLISGCEAGKIIFKNDEACYPTAAITTLCNAYLLLDSNIKTFQGIYSTICDAIKGRTKRTLANTLYPISTNVLRLAGLTCCALGFAPSVIFSEELFEDNPVFATTIAVTSTLGILGSTGYGVYWTIDNIIHAASHSLGSNHNVKLVSFFQKVQRLSSLIDSCSMKVFARSVQELRIRMGDVWADRYDIPSDEALSSYLAQGINAANAPLLN